MPFNFITSFAVSRQLKQNFACLSVSEVNKPVHTACDECWIFISTFNRLNLILQICNPGSSLVYVPKRCFSTSRSNQQKLVTKFKPRNIEHSFLLHSTTYFLLEDCYSFYVWSFNSFDVGWALPNNSKVFSLPNCQNIWSMRRPLYAGYCKFFLYANRKILWFIHCIRIMIS